MERAADRTFVVNVELSKLVESIVVGLDGGVRRLEIERHTHNWGRHSLQRKLPWRRGGCSACKQAQVGDVRIDCHSESPSGVRNLLFDYNSRFLGPKGPRNDKELSVSARLNRLRKKSRKPAALW